MTAKETHILMGNEAIGWGLLENGCTVVTSYPGTPASEILAAVLQLKQSYHLPVHAEWAINEKVAFEIALAHSYQGGRAAVSMKQVGLNVAADPLMSSAYTGVRGGFLVVSADDPGPHSSQTEQDSRFMAMFAHVPVFDPSSPREAKAMVAEALALGEEYQLPVMLRPTTRVCHARQDVEVAPPKPHTRELLFERDPGRWAATPKFRYLLHQELNAKLADIAADDRFIPQQVNPGVENGDFAVVASGVAFAHGRELLEDLGLIDSVPLYQVRLAYPLSATFIDLVFARHRRLLVLEEPGPVIEYQLRDRSRVLGRLTGTVPSAGELTPEKLATSMAAVLPVAAPPIPKPAPGRRPTLCPGCPHRAAFFAIKRAMPKGLYPSDIGCYTLGLNLGAVDTVLCMGAGIGMAAGFYHGQRVNGGDPPALAVTVGDSTFFHSGIPALINGVIDGARFVLVILDNGTTAMTGFQPVPHRSGSGDRISLEKLVAACGVDFVEVGDPYDLKAFIRLLRQAKAHSSAADGGIAVVIARRPCLRDRRSAPSRPAAAGVAISDECKGCRYCVDHFECPALIYDEAEDRVQIDANLCVCCGVCALVCPRGAIQVAAQGRSAS